MALVDGGVYGDGVNVAARLEQLCEPGGVMVSGTTFDHLQGKLNLPLEFAGGTPGCLERANDRLRNVMQRVSGELDSSEGST